MPSRLIQLAGVVLAAAILLAVLIRWQAASAWDHADFEARAVALVARETTPPLNAGLVARTLPGPPNAADRFVCVVSPARADHPPATYEIQFRRGAFGTTVNEIYTPRWTPPDSGAIAQQDCAGAAQH